MAYLLLGVEGEMLRAMKVNTGKNFIPLAALVAIWSVSAIASLPGLAISPILNDLDKIFPAASELEVDMLESLPSLLIIPFMLLAGRWSIKGNKMALLVVGTSIFLIGGFGSLLARKLWELILLGAVIGVGAGIIIPLSTGLVVDYFTGDYRVRQLGISSAINNLTLVIATSLTGYLADIEWHYAFAVYLLPAITLLLVPALSHTKPEPEPEGGAQRRQTTLRMNVIIGLMLFYFAITYFSLIVTFNTSYLAAEVGMDATTSGIIISIFFLAIMTPGLALNLIVKLLGRMVNVWSLVVMGLGLILMSLPHPTILHLTVGAALAGLGYGVMQPVIYDKAATNAPPHLSTLALSLVMAVNYFAILVAPFMVTGVDKLFGESSPSFAFLFNGLATLVLAAVALLFVKRSRVFGTDD